MELTTGIAWALTVLTVTSLVGTALLHLRVRSKLRRKLAKLRGQHVVVIGASVGEQVAYEYALRGARLVVSARRADRLASVRERCLELGAADVLIAPCDVTSVSSLRALHTAATDFLRGTVHAVIFTAGALTVCPFDALMDPDVSDTDAAAVIDRAFAINATAPIHAARLFLPTLRATADGRKRSSGLSGSVTRPALTVVSSVAGLLPAPSRALYCGAKAALHGFFDSLRIEERRRAGPRAVRIQLVAPGTIAGTELRATAVDGHLWRDGMPTGTSRGALSTQDVARAVFHQTEDLVVLPRWYEGAVLLRHVWPSLVDALAMKKYQ
ncbi:hypothetical protein H9P43_000645 [Blastocladiella emersonii ATCC 22665]|nr:hypothetical protein H9P43_000645 [Blastocladiella emersonii ATCC 22665]